MAGPSLRDDIFSSLDAPVGPRFAAPSLTANQLDAIDAASMGSLRRGYESGRLGTEANYNLAREASLRAAGDAAAADALRSQIEGLQRRASIYAPAVQQLEQIHGIGDVPGYVAGQIGSGAASMQDPMLAAGAATALGTGLSFVPHPGTQMVGAGLRNVLAPALAYALNQRQLKGEQYGKLSEDPTVMAQFTPQEINDQANIYGGAAALLDTAIPGLVGRQLGGAALLSKGAKPLLPGGLRVAGGLVGEGATEAGQELGSQYAHGLLNPERDTSHDTSALANSFVGGLAGSTGPVLAGHAVDSGLRGLRAVPGAVKDAAGSVVDMAKDAAEKAPGVSAAVDAVKGAYGATMDLKDRLRAASAEKNDVAADEARLMSGFVPPDILNNPDPNVFAAWDKEHAPKRMDLLSKRLAERAQAGDERAQELLAGLASPDPADQLMTMDLAAEHILGAQGLEELSREAEKGLGSRVAARGGAIVGRAMETVRDAGKAAVEGFRNRKLNTQVPAEQTPAWTGDEYESRRADAMKAFDRASLMSEHLKAQAEAQAPRYASLGERGKNIPRFMGEVGRQIADLAENWKGTDAKPSAAKFDRLRYDLNRLALRLNGAYGKDAPRVVAELQGMADPKAKALFGHLNEELAVVSGKNGANRTMEAEQQAYDAMLKGIDQRKQAELLQQGIDLRAPRTRQQLRGLIEDAASGRLTSNERTHLNELLGPNNLQRAIQAFAPRTEEQDVVESAYESNKATNLSTDEHGNIDVATSENTPDEEGASDYEKRQGEKLVDRRAGAAVYSFQGLKPRANQSLSGKQKDLLGFSGDWRPRLYDLRTNDGSPEEQEQRKTLLKNAEEALSKHLGGDKSWTIETRSALEDMARREGVSLQTALGPYAGQNKVADVKSGGRTSDPDQAAERLGLNTAFINKIITRYMQFMRDEATRAGGEESPKAAPFLARARNAEEVLRDRLRQSRMGDQAVLQTEPGQREEILKRAITYLSNFGVVVAERGTNRDPEQISADQVLQLAESGRKLHAAKGDSGANKNDLLMFESKLAQARPDGSPGMIYVRARDLVQFARQARLAQTENPESKNVNVQYLEDLSTGLSALIASGRVEGMPRGFEEGRIPPTLPLATTTYGKWDAARKREARETAQPADGPGDARRSKSYQNAVAKDALNSEPFVADDVANANPPARTLADEAEGHIRESRAQGAVASTRPLTAPKAQLDAQSTATLIASLQARRAKFIEGGATEKGPRIKAIDAELARLKEQETRREVSRPSTKELPAALPKNLGAELLQQAEAQFKAASRGPGGLQSDNITLRLGGNTYVAFQERPGQYRVEDAANKVIARTAAPKEGAAPVGKTSDRPSGAAGRKLNAQVASALGDARGLMATLGFKSAPPQFADVAAKLLTDPRVDPKKFAAESAEALSHLLMRGSSGDAIRKALSADTWQRERKDIVRALVSKGLNGSEARDESYRTMVQRALAGELRSRPASKGLLSSLMEAVRTFISAFTRMVGTPEFEAVVRRELNKLIETAKSPLDLRKNFKQVTFQEAIESDPAAAEVLAYLGGNKQFTLTGSIVLAHNGAVYRNATNMLHDLDFRVSGELADAEAFLRRKYDGAFKASEFATSISKTDTFIVPPPGATVTNIKRQFGDKGGVISYEVERGGQVIGRKYADENGEHREGEAGTIVDFFTGVDPDATSTILFQHNGQQHAVRATSAAGVLRTKLSMARDKDLNDYLLYVPAAGRKLNEQGFSQQNPSNKISTQAEMDEARNYVAKVLGPQITVAFKQLTGYSGEFIEAQNLIEISTTPGPGTMQVAYHEALHAFFAKFVRGNPQALEAFKALTDDKKIMERVVALLHDHPAAIAQLTDGEERLAYIYQFWAADLLDLPVKKAGILEAIKRFFHRVLGMVTDSERATAILEAFHAGKMTEPSVAGQVIAKALGEGTLTTKALRKFDRVMAKAQEIALPTQMVLARSESKTARELAPVFWTNPGDEEHGDKGEGYINAKLAEARKYKNLLDKEIQGLSDRDLKEVADLLQAGKATDLASIPYAPHRDAVKGIDALLKRFYRYMTEERGLQLGKINEGYFPRVWDVGTMLEKQEEFIGMLKAKYQHILADGARSSKLSEDEVARRIFEKIISSSVGEHVLPQRNDGVLTPFFSSGLMRELNWLRPGDSAPYQSKDLIGTLTNYFHSGARAAEYSHRFGQDGRLLAEKLVDIEKELREAGAAKFKKGEFKTAEEGRAWAERRMQQVHKAVGAIEGTLGSDIGSAWRNTSAWITVYQNLRLLPLTLFASVVDPLGMVARGATMRQAYDTFLRGMREVFANWGDMLRKEPKQRQADQWEQLALAVGTVDAAIFSHHVADEYSSMYMAKKISKVNETFFRLNGMESWNKGMRVGATQAAVNFIERHSKLPEVHSARWLKELGLTPADLTFDAEGRLVTDKNVLALQKSISKPAAEQEMVKVHQAIRRWVEGAVLTPNAAQRPAWASDPHYSMFFHLKQFSYSFHQTILKRAVSEMNHGNMAPIGSFLWYIPVMMASDITKGLLQGGGELPAHMKGWDLGDHLMNAATRSGVLTVGNIAIDAQQDIYSLAGPAIEQVADSFGRPIGRTIVDALPGKPLFAEALR